MANLKHNHQVVFGRREPNCPRCDELNLGAPTRQWRGYTADQQRTAEIRQHRCTERCGPVCTFGDW